MTSTHYVTYCMCVSHIVCMWLHACMDESVVCIMYMYVHGVSVCVWVHIQGFIIWWGDGGGRWPPPLPEPCVFVLNSYLLFYSFFSTYLRCLWGHYPAITPKCLIGTRITWSIGVKCLFNTRNMVISLGVIWKPQMVWKSAPEAI